VEKDRRPALSPGLAHMNLEYGEIFDPGLEVQKALQSYAAKKDK
jgi:hypothetical protein